MAAAVIHSFLVHPGKNVTPQPKVRGTVVTKAKSGKLWGLLEGIYDKAHDECTIDISFNATEGKQKNPCRDLLLKYVRSRDIVDGRALATRLQAHTTRTPQLGLLFLIVGDETTQQRQRIVVSRFPANTGILAEEHRNDLTVKFIEKIFMRNAHAYKAVVYEDASLSSGFWDGKAIDKQVDDSVAYWINGFLASDFKTTSAAGTKRLGDAIRKATAKTADASVANELISAVKLAANADGEVTSIDKFLDRFALSDSAAALVRTEVPTNLHSKEFKLSAPELSRSVPLLSVYLDNGGTMMAQTDKFDKVFVREPLKGDGRLRFTTVGKIVEEKLRREGGGRRRREEAP